MSDLFPQSGGEFLAQELYGSRERADRFYRDQMLDRLTPQMVEFLGEQTEMVVASVDTDGRPDASIRFGEPGFVAVVDERTVAWPELRGNGVMTTVGNLLKNPPAHLMFLDRTTRIGLHLRGYTRVLELDDVADEYPQLRPRRLPDAARAVGRDAPVERLHPLPQALPEDRRRRRVGHRRPARQGRRLLRREGHPRRPGRPDSSRLLAGGDEDLAGAAEGHGVAGPDERRVARAELHRVDRDVAAGGDDDARPGRRQLQVIRRDRAAAATKSGTVTT